MPGLPGLVLGIRRDLDHPAVDRVGRATAAEDEAEPPVLLDPTLGKLGREEVEGDARGCSVVVEVDRRQAAGRSAAQGSSRGDASDLGPARLIARKV